MQTATADAKISRSAAKAHTATIRREAAKIAKLLDHMARYPHLYEGRELGIRATLDSALDAIGTATDDLAAGLGRAR